MAKRPLSKDKLTMVPRDHAAAAAQTALFQLQDRESPEEIVLGVATLFAALCMRCELDPEALHTMGRRVIMEPSEGDAPTNGSIQVLKDWAGLKLMAQEVSIS
jgi:hypothetical protein